jgi:hypothetical protein
MVIGCRRTAPADRYCADAKIICGKCWSLAPLYLRRRISRLERIGRKLGVQWDTVTWADTQPDSRERLVVWLHAAVFDKLARAATEVKVGIA